MDEEDRLVAYTSNFAAIVFVVIERYLYFLTGSQLFDVFPISFVRWGLLSIKRLCCQARNRKHEDHPRNPSDMVSHVTTSAQIWALRKAVFSKIARPNFRFQLYFRPRYTGRPFRVKLRLVG
jgi:hypothetical protein